MSATPAFSQLLRITVIVLVGIGLSACVTRDEESGAKNFEMIPAGESTQIARIA